MKILFLTPQTPYPPDQGAAIRNFNFIKYLAANHEIFLLSFSRPNENPATSSALNHLQKYCRQVWLVQSPPARSKLIRLRDMIFTTAPDLARRLYSSDSEFSQKLAAVIKEVQPAIVQCEGLELAPFVLEWRKQNSSNSSKNIRLVLDEHNAEYLLQQRIFEQEWQATLKQRVIALYSKLQASRLAKFERTAIETFDLTLTVSEPDKLALEKLGRPARPLAVVANGIDIHEFTPDATTDSSETLVFTGTMDYRPNIDAVLWFGRKVWPLVQTAKPSAKVYIVGRRPTEAVLALKNLPGVEVTGEVADARPYIRESTVYIVPMRVGGGVRFKVLEAMAMGKPVVTTTLGADGITLSPGQEAIVADTPIAFAEAILSLVDNPTYRTELAQAGRIFVEQNYAWERIIPLLENLFITLLAI